jgi:hypothetical protein
MCGNCHSAEDAATIAAKGSLCRERPWLDMVEGELPEEAGCAGPPGDLMRDRFGCWRCSGEPGVDAAWLRSARAL